MSGFSYPQSIFNGSIYNPSFYLSLDPSGFISYEYAQTLYLSKNDYRLTYITGITPNVATAGVALVLGNDLSLSGLGAVPCSSVNATTFKLNGTTLDFSNLTSNLIGSSLSLTATGDVNFITLSNSLATGRSTIYFNRDAAAS